MNRLAQRAYRGNGTGSRDGRGYPQRRRLPAHWGQCGRPVANTLAAGVAGLALFQKRPHAFLLVFRGKQQLHRFSLERQG